VVVTNPPYISSARLEGSVKQFIEEKYPEAKTDLFSVFILRCLELCNKDGLTGYMTPFVWMFISSYENLRKSLIDSHFINNLIQLEYSGFDGATVPICTFTLRNRYVLEGKGSYIRLSDFRGAQNQAPKTLEAIRNPNCEWSYTANQKDFLKIPGNPIGYWLKTSFFNLFQKFEPFEKLGNAVVGLQTGDNDRFLRFWHEISYSSIHLTTKMPTNFILSWYMYNKAGSYRKWYTNLEYVVNWKSNGVLLKNFKDKNGKLRSRPQNLNYYFKGGITWSDVTSNKTSFRIVDDGVMFDTCAPTFFVNDKELELNILAVINNKVYEKIIPLLNPTIHFTNGNFKNLPFCSLNSSYNEIVSENIEISKLDWLTKENSWSFLRSNLIQFGSNEVEESFDLFKLSWKNKFFQLHKNEEELNSQFIEIYGLQDELTPEVPLEDITILKQETSVVNGELVFNVNEVFSQFISYAVGCMFGRYSLDKEGLILANQGESLKEYLINVAKTTDQVSFVPDEDNIIPVLDDEWFEDDIVARFYAFLKASFGEKEFQKNLAFVEECLDKDIRKYFVKDFYNDHIMRYKKRPIYWMFSSPKGSFNVLIYLHRYTPDTLNKILNSYLREFIEKLTLQRKQLEHIEVNGTPSEQSKARKEIDKIDIKLADCKQYEAEILYPLAAERIALDLDDGVLVNYNKLGAAVALVPGLNDSKTKKKVKEFDWIDTTQIR
jgi:hypothetical protein